MGASPAVRPAQRAAPEKLVVVGCGDHFRKNVGPTLATMESFHELNVLATVDLVERQSNLDFLNRTVPHCVRHSGEPLSRCLKHYKGENPIVLLAHPHEFHAADALELVSGGFRVVVEKPYALVPKDLELLRVAAARSPHRIALAEYYLMMKAVPLLHAGGLLNSTSFYLHDECYLKSLDGHSVTAHHGCLDLIGRIRMVYADVLEGEGEVGSFHHRGRQFADDRIGVGAIMDLAIHAVAPLIALEGHLGSFPDPHSVLLRTAVCETYLQFAQRTYGVPPRCVPETYAELAFSTVTGVPIVVSVGKYVLRNRNQRRIVIVGDEGEALLDMSNNVFSMGSGDSSPVSLLTAQKNLDSKYRAVLLAAFAQLREEAVFNFDDRDVALRANEWALTIHLRSRDGFAKATYSRGASPSQIGSQRLFIGGSAVEEGSGAELYYQTQYQRMSALEDHAFKMSGGVLVLTAAVFTFASKGTVQSFLPWKIVVWLMLIANLAAMFYIGRVMGSFAIHLRRAKIVLRRSWPKMWDIDSTHRHFDTREAKSDEMPPQEIQWRQVILLVLHAVLLLASVRILFGAAANEPVIQLPSENQKSTNQIVPAARPSEVDQSPQAPQHSAGRGSNSGPRDATKPKEPVK